MRRWVSRIVLGTIVPVMLFLTGWWIPYLLGVSELVPVLASIGFVLGVIADVTLLRHRLDSLYRLPVAAQAAIATFYTVMIYGFFMGLPVPVLLVSIGWGYAVVTALAAGDADPRRARWAARGSAALMLVACLATAWLAFREPWIAGEVRGMLGLSFTPSLVSLVIASVLGGLGLVAIAYVIPKALVNRVNHRSRGASATA